LCDIWGLGHENFQTPPDFNSYDLIVNLENYGDGWLPNLSSAKKPFKMIWCIDAHVRGTNPYEHMFRNGAYDVLAHSTKDYVKETHHRWLPNCSDPSLVKKMDGIQKVHPIGFCGNHVTPIRKATVDTLSRIFGMKQDIFVIGDEMVKAINSYRIHFNMNIANDINYRSFETLACETVLLTNYNRQYEELGFVNGENCFFYADQTDLIRVTTSLLNRLKGGDPSLNQVAINGAKLFHAKHTITNRAQQIIQIAFGG
jgi:spore maturation protein CgeB